MAKTLFGPGVIVTSKWLNGAQQVYFDGLDEDWHFPPISVNDIQRGGEFGLDGLYITLSTDQTYGNAPVTGAKTFMGSVEFGNNVQSIASSAPKSWSTDAKFNQGGSSQSFAVKYANLQNEDLLTKSVMTEQINNFPIIDEGAF